MWHGILTYISYLIYDMKNAIRLLLFSMVFFLTGCDLIGGIFEAGFYVGIIVVVAVIALIMYIIYRVFKR